MISLFLICIIIDFVLSLYVICFYIILYNNFLKALYKEIRFVGWDGMIYRRICKFIGWNETLIVDFCEFLENHLLKVR